MHLAPPRRRRQRKSQHDKEKMNMPRIPYQPLDLAEPKAVVDAIRARRGGTLLNLDRMLLHSPAFAKGWNAFLGEVRNNLELSPRMRELAMCQVALLNGADYEFHHHAPEYLKAGGTQAQLDALCGLIDEADAFDANERAIMALIRAVTVDVEVNDAVFDAARAALANDQLVVELVGVTATYNMVSRFLVALGVAQEEEGK
jgi:alkylhydroperoxidase family enzyme